LFAGQLLLLLQHINLLDPFIKLAIEPQPYEHSSVVSIGSAILFI
jgi:hypothetical protein